MTVRPGSPPASVLADGRARLLHGGEVRLGLADMDFADFDRGGRLAHLLLVALASDGPGDGLLLLGWTDQAEVRDSDLRLLESFAEQAALALQLARAQEDRGRLAVFEDRDRIGRDLHDLVIQRLFAVGLKLENTRRMTARPQVAERLTSAVDDIDATIKDIRRSIFELSTPAGAADLRAELAEIVNDAAQVLGFTPRLQTDGPVDTLVTADLRPHLLAVLREMLSNVARHADATSVVVRLSAGDEVLLTVTDDGAGFVDNGRRSGLRNMAERAESLGGSFQVRQAGPEGGTVAVWRAPTRSAS